MKSRSINLIFFLLFLSVGQLIAQEQKEKFKKNQIKLNVLPFFGGSYERLISPKQSIAVGYNAYKTPDFFLLEKDKVNHRTVWLDYKFHQKGFYIGPYVKYRQSETINGGSSCCATDPLEGTGLALEQLAAGFLFGSQVFVGEHFLIESNIGIGYRNFISERVLNSNLNVDIIVDGLYPTNVTTSRGINLDLRWRLHFGWRF